MVRKLYHKNGSEIVPHLLLLVTKRGPPVKKLNDGSEIVIHLLLLVTKRGPPAPSSRSGLRPPLDSPGYMPPFGRQYNPRMEPLSGDSQKIYIASLASLTRQTNIPLHVLRSGAHIRLPSEARQSRFIGVSAERGAGASERAKRAENAHILIAPL